MIVLPAGGETAVSLKLVIRIPAPPLPLTPVVPVMMFLLIVLLFEPSLMPIPATCMFSIVLLSITAFCVLYQTSMPFPRRTSTGGVPW